jgi:transcriptional regulator with XRE-family HTH domain
MAGKSKSKEKPRSKRKRPSRLAEKLVLIRVKLGMSQGGLIRHLGLEEALERDYISKFERGILEPTLDVLLAYARATSITGRGEFLEALIDDKMDLPTKIPADPTAIASHKKRVNQLSKQ